MTTTTKTAGEAMQITDEQIDKLIREYRLDGTDSVAMFNFARALLASKPAVPQGVDARMNEIAARHTNSVIEFDRLLKFGRDLLADLPAPIVTEDRASVMLRAASACDILKLQFPDSAADICAKTLRRMAEQLGADVASPTAPAQSCGDAEQADEAVTYEQIANRFLKEDDFAALFTFHSQCSDSECDGYTERPETMERLAELGVVQRLIGGRGKRYGTTAFGAWLVEAAFSQNPGWPLRTTAEHNKRESAGHALYLRESVPNSIAWVKLDRNTRESWRRKALPDLVDAARAKDSK